MRYEIVPHCEYVEKKDIVFYDIIVKDNDLTVREIKDISTNCTAVQNLVEKLNEENPELIHLNDIIEDFSIEYF